MFRTVFFELWRQSNVNRYRKDADRGTAAANFLLLGSFLCVDKVLLERINLLEKHVNPSTIQVLSAALCILHFISYYFGFFLAGFTCISWPPAHKQVYEVLQKTECWCCDRKKKYPGIQCDLIYVLFVTLTPGDSTGLQRIISQTSCNASSAESKCEGATKWIKQHRRTKP